MCTYNDMIKHDPLAYTEINVLTFSHFEIETNLSEVCVLWGAGGELILLESKFAASLTGDIGPDRDRAETHELNLNFKNANNKKHLSIL